MSTSDGSPSESEDCKTPWPHTPHDDCDGGVDRFAKESPYLEEQRDVPGAIIRPEGVAAFRDPERGLTTGARKKMLRRNEAEAAHRVAVEPYGERSRTLPFPWGVLATAVVVFGLAAYGIFWTGHELGWW